MATKVVMPLLAVALLAFLGFMLWRAKWQTYHFEAVEPGVLYRCGNRGVRELAHAVEQGKIRTIVTLIDDQELADKGKPEFADEVRWAAEHGVKIERVPIALGGWPSVADVQMFLSVASDKANQPVLVHCAQGVRRTGFVVAAYQRAKMNWSADRCRASMLTFGHSQRTVGDVQKFIEVYDPLTGKVPEGMPTGKE